MRKRCQRAQRRLLALVDAEIGLETPDRNHHRARHAILLLDALQQRGMLLHQALRLADALIDARQPEFLETALEMPLTAVKREDRWIRRKIGKCRRSPLGDAFRGCLTLEAHDKGAEISAALRSHRRSARDDEQQTQEGNPNQLVRKYHRAAPDPRRMRAG